MWLKCGLGKLQAWLSEFEFITIIKPLSLINFRSWSTKRNSEKEEKPNTQASQSDTQNCNRDRLRGLYHIASETLHFPGQLVYITWKWSLTSMSKDVISNYYLSVFRQAIHDIQHSLGKPAFQRSWSFSNSCLFNQNFVTWLFIVSPVESRSS